MNKIYLYLVGLYKSKGKPHGFVEYHKQTRLPLIIIHNNSIYELKLDDHTYYYERNDYAWVDTNPTVYTITVD